MGLCLSGINQKLKATTMEIHVSESHPLIRVANALDWKEMADLISPDLKKSTLKFFWWFGRKIYVRTHLGILALQCLLETGWFPML